MSEQRQKIAIVSGGSQGIGLAITEQFLAEGFTVYIASRKQNPLLNHSNLHWFEADLSNKKEVQQFAQFIKEGTKIIDVLVNNVGVFIPGSLMHEEDGVFETQVNTNLASTYHLTRALYPLVKKSEKNYIFTICSTASVTPYINGGSYCISKYAQLGFTKVLREEAKADNIRVSAVMPGATLTNSWSETELPADKFINPSSVAQLIWSAYQMPQNTVIEEITVRPMDGDIS